jgi:hypothetical protein
VAIAVAAAATPPMITPLTGALRFENRCFPFIVQNPAINPYIFRGGSEAGKYRFLCTIVWICLDSQITSQIGLDYSSKAVAITLESEMHADQCPYLNEKRSILQRSLLLLIYLD